MIRLGGLSAAQRLVADARGSAAPVIAAPVDGRALHADIEAIGLAFQPILPALAEPLILYPPLALVVVPGFARQCGRHGLRARRHGAIVSVGDRNLDTHARIQMDGLSADGFPQFVALQRRRGVCRCNPRKRNRTDDKYQSLHVFLSLGSYYRFEASDIAPKT